MVTYQSGHSVRNIFFKLQKTVNFIFLNEEVTFSLNNETRLYDPHGKHIITGYLHMIDNSNLIKGPNDREACTLNFNNVFGNINSTIDSYIQYLSKMSKNLVESSSKWNEKVHDKVKMKIKRIKSNMKQLQTKPLLCDDEVKNNLGSLHISLVTVTIDKTPTLKNYVFLLKMKHLVIITPKLIQK